MSGLLNERDIDLLHRLAPRVADCPDARTRAAARLQRRVGRRLNPPRRRWMAVPIVAAATLIAVSSLPGSDTSPAAAALMRIALRVEARPSPHIGPGQAWYVDERGAYLDGVDAIVPPRGFSYMAASTHREWIACNGASHVIRTDGPPRFLDGADRQAWIAMGRPHTGGTLNIRDHSPHPFALLGGQANCAGVRAMPTDPAAIRAVLASNTRYEQVSPAYAELDAIAETLRNAPLSSRQAAALYRAAAGIEGIELLGPARDHTGRRGLAIAADDTVNGGRLELIIDPRTGLLLGDDERALRAFPRQHVRAGELLGWTVYLAAGVRPYS